MRDSYGVFKDAGIEVFGVSPDSVKSHTQVRRKYGLPQRLLADPDHRLAEALGVWGEKSFMGKKFMGITRSTFVIGPDGTIERVYPKVKPDQHGAEIVRDLRLAQRQVE